MSIKMNAYLKYWTADECSEVLPYEEFLSKKDADDLYVKLWGFLSESKNPTPLGGDGPGRVETPCGRLSLENDDKSHHWWGKLTEIERGALNKAIEKELNSGD